jgi:hypothetical protein
MKKLATLVALAINLTVGHAAQAQDTRIGFGATVLYPTSLETGAGIPPSVNYTLNVLQHMDDWALVGTAGMNVTFGEFAPRPQISLGPSWRLGESDWALGGSALYRYLPEYDNPSDDHFVATSAVLAHSFGDYSVNFVTGPGYLIETDAWSWAVGFGMTFWFN